MDHNSCSTNSKKTIMTRRHSEPGDLAIDQDTQLQSDLSHQGDSDSKFLPQCLKSDESPSKTIERSLRDELGVGGSTCDLERSGTRRLHGLVYKQKLIGSELTRILDRSAPQIDRASFSVMKVMRYIHKHLFDSGLNVNKIKIDCCISNNNISTLFRMAVGMGIREYIERQRMNAAARLLGHKSVEIYLIAHAIGYDYQETFLRAFRRVFDCTPSEYRLAMREY